MNCLARYCEISIGEREEHWAEIMAELTAVTEVDTPRKEKA